MAKHCHANTQNISSKSLSFDLWLEAPWRTSLRPYRFLRAHGPVEPSNPRYASSSAAQQLENYWVPLLNIHGFHHFPSDSVGGDFFQVHPFSHSKKKYVALRETNISPLKMDSLGRWFISFWVSAYLQGLLLLVSGRVSQSIVKPLCVLPPTFTETQSIPSGICTRYFTCQERENPTMICSRFSNMKMTSNEIDV